ncbi:hypothetical protein J2X31_003680 [Flavobacterium arsenatis]|uniref:Uncharacterized protein n=1 Tax=Flavobacterium arsenatis TaxID=1484332 RepID=A0ABU1TV05_9FLAO|nr:hypothetical protein [Flavobacterium arsenatis]MDR6969647.1 hypothetical protein [Flavobacterium arsenatis]
MSSSNKLPLNYLVFDDENEELQQNKINVKVQGIDCNVIFINPFDFYNVDEDIFDIDQFIQKIKAETKGKQINLIASDWNMVPKTSNYSEINALEIIEILVKTNDKYKKTQYLIYSGKSKDVSHVFVNKIKGEIDINPDDPINSKQLLSLLLELKLKFSTRAERFNEINTLINSNKTISLIVLNTLSNFDENILLNTGNDYFDGKKIGELLDLISKNNDLGLKFIREFIELSIANYTELNE